MCDNVGLGSRRKGKEKNLGKTSVNGLTAGTREESTLEILGPRDVPQDLGMAYPGNLTLSEYMVFPVHPIVQ